MNHLWKTVCPACGHKEMHSPERSLLSLKVEQVKEHNSTCGECGHIRIEYLLTCEAVYTFGEEARKYIGELIDGNIQYKLPKEEASPPKYSAQYTAADFCVGIVDEDGFADNSVDISMLGQGVAEMLSDILSHLGTGQKRVTETAKSVLSLPPSVLYFNVDSTLISPREWIRQTKASSEAQERRELLLAKGRSKLVKRNV